MNAQMRTRNIMIAKRRTTIRLEAAVWHALDEICENEKISRHDLCTRIDGARGSANRAQAVRATVVNYFRLTAQTPNASMDVIAEALRGLDSP
jgi:predicted DNA-binding ribbon-helix-helix protein